MAQKYGLGSDWSSEIVLLAHQQKSGKPYLQKLGEQHIKVLLYFTRYAEATDTDLAFDLGIVQSGARRCELRDAKCIARVGTRDRMKTWRITRKGHKILRIALNNEDLVEDFEED